MPSYVIDGTESPCTNFSQAEDSAQTSGSEEPEGDITTAHPRVRDRDKRRHLPHHH